MTFGIQVISLSISYNVVTNSGRNNHENTILKCKHVLIPIYDFRFLIVNSLLIRKIIVKITQENKQSLTFALLFNPKIRGLFLIFFPR